MSKEWKTVPDDTVCLVWRRACNCPDADELAEVHPDSVGEVGNPICPECDEEYQYDHVEVREDPKGRTYVVIEKICGDPVVNLVTTDVDKAWERFLQLVRETESPYAGRADDDFVGEAVFDYGDDCCIYIKVLGPEGE